MMKVALGEIHLITTICLKGLVFQLLVVNELRFIYDDAV